jgi:predicted ABC-type ATPase
MPNLYVIGGPNGAGKTTIARTLLPEFLGCYEFVNADLIAAGLSPFRPEGVAIRAGRLMLERMSSLAESGVDFAFESTLASRSFVPFLKNCKARGYEIHLLYVWLDSPERAIERVANRVLEGGHFVPDETVKRRYETGRKNFVQLYLPLADSWRVFDNSTEPKLVEGSPQNELTERMLEGARKAVANVLDK